MQMMIHALLVGINNYNEIRKLNGCVGDIEKIENYLTQNAAPCKVEKLLDDKATKMSIVEAFNRSKQNVCADDSFLFYFSGHGTQERADPLWNETDGKLECIVCYDDNPDNPSGFLLSDKELRYLIFDLSKTGCHIVTIFDCCHSGDNTRNFSKAQAAFDDYVVKERRYGNFFPQRSWNEFIFSSSIHQEDVQGKHINEYLPQGTHIQIAACESDESALEVNNEGVFTKTFLKVLKDSAGSITYFDLRSRIRQYLRFVYEQQPRIYTMGLSDEESQRLLFTRFLNRQDSNDHQFIAEAVYNERKGWMLNLGAIHGIKKDTIVRLIDPESSQKIYPAEVKQVFIDYSLLEPVKGMSIRFRNIVLKTKVEGLEMHKLQLYIKKYADNLKKLKKIADALINCAAGHFIFTEEDKADYTIHVREEFIYITHPGELFRPLVQPIQINKAYISTITEANQLCEFLKHISRWRYIQQLQNKTAFDFNKELLKIDITQVFQNGTEEMIAIDKRVQGTGYANLHPSVKSSLRIRLTNETDQKVFIAAAYLSYNFQVYIHLLERKVELLNPGDTVSLRIKSKSSFETKNDLINIHLPDVVHEYNWAEYHETIKIIICNEEFTHEALSLNLLPAPYTLTDMLKKTETVRSFDFKEDKTMDLPGWITQTIHLRYPNMLYNKVETDRIDQMLESDKTAFFARGLYGENSKKD